VRAYRLTKPSRRPSFTSMSTEKLATLSAKCKGTWVSIDVFAPGEAISIPAGEGRQYIARVSDFDIRNGPVTFLLAGVNLGLMTGLTPDERTQLVDWIPRAGLIALIDVLCDRPRPRVGNVVFLSAANIEHDPQREDMAFFRKRCRFDVLRVMEHRLSDAAGDMNLSIDVLRESGLLTRIYSDEDLASALTFWSQRSLVLTLTFDNSCLVDEHKDEEISKLVRSYDWEESRSAPNVSAQVDEFDVFVCHASEDKEEFVRPLVRELRAANLAVWYDELALKLGDSLRQAIDSGLSRSRYGIVVLSRSFFKKDWPQRELDGLADREVNGRKVILPIWHKLEHSEVSTYSPLLAGRVAVKSHEPMEAIVREILDVVRPV